MSSTWKDERNQAYNVFKTTTYNANWGKGQFTCIHTMNDAEGAWWRVNFGIDLTITKVKILNRKDCCGGRLNGAKVFVGDNLCGTINNPEGGKWAVVKCKATGGFLKI